jgi:hypothetical protein
MKSPGLRATGALRTEERGSPLLSVRSKLIECEQVDHNPVFNASLAQSHNVSSHKRHEFIVQLKGERLARVRERSGRDVRLVCVGIPPLLPPADITNRSTQAKPRRRSTPVLARVSNEFSRRD